MRGNPITPKWLGILAAAAVLQPHAAAASDPQVTATIRELTSDYAWGYRVGVKQSLGSYMLGRSVHQVSRRTQGTDGNPDYLLWVDEHADHTLTLEHPTDHFHGAVPNPGGAAVFTSGADAPEIGRLWYVYSGRAQDLAFSLFCSSSLFDPGGFNTMLDSFITKKGATTACLHAVGSHALLAYRTGPSSQPATHVTFQRYDLAGPEPVLDLELGVGKGYLHPEWGQIGIEQLWTRWDPRRNALALTWQWFRVEDKRFGSNPFLLSEDHGATWQLADGSPLPAYPVDYSMLTDVMVPWDHIAHDESTNWHPRDLGFAPDGTPWITLPQGDASNSNNSRVLFWFWDGESWQNRLLTEGLHYDSKPFACGTTRDYLVLVYSEYATTGTLRGRVSRDNGRTWSDPVVIDTLDDPAEGGIHRICWVSFIQPADRYLDNTARFVVGYYNSLHGNAGKNYRNNLRWVKVQVGPRSDFNGDGVVNTLDAITFLNAYTAGDWRADFNDDGTVNTLDLIAFLAAFAEEL